MLPASEHHIPDGLLAANVLLKEKPRHGVSNKNPAPHQGISEAKSTLAIGMRASQHLNAVRESERARYYSSTGGRFLSPDPGWYLQADPTNPQSWNQYSYALNNPLINTDPTGEECVWDDGSFDAADDPQTGNAKGCLAQGGTYENPSDFESALLTNGQQNNVNPGDWSGQANSTIAQSFLTPTTTVTGTPTQNGTFSMNMSQTSFISMMQQSNFSLSDLDQVLANHHISAHSGIQMRQDTQGCNLHVNFDRNSGKNGQPVTGDFHYDMLNPNPNSNPADALITAPLHGAEALVDMGMTKVGFSGTVGDRACSNP